MECYSQSMYRDVHNLIKKGLIEPPYYVNFVLGMMHQGAIEATPDTLYLDVPVPAGATATSTPRPPAPRSCR